ncbi:MAG: nicotinamide riboside transporter PnuC [Luteibaculaceae bacterium]
MLEQLFLQYQSYPWIEIVLEITAVVFGLLSVLFAKNNHIAVFPTGILSTGIFIGLLWHWGLLGDMLINIFYLTMSIYGWYVWLYGGKNQTKAPVSSMVKSDYQTAWLMAFGSAVMVIILYVLNDKFTHWTAYVDTLTTAIFFVGMWLMAKRKLEHWWFWIIGDIISVPLYLYKGYAFTALQYFIFVFIAIAGLYQWKKIYNKTQLT